MRRGLATVCLLGLAALAALYAFTFTDRFRELARREVLDSIRGSIRGELAVERLEGSVWGDLRLAGVSLRLGAVDVVRVPEVTLHYSLLPLLRGELRVTAIDLAAPVVDLRRDERGAWNLAAALSTPPDASSTAATPRLRIDAVRVAAGKISVTPCRAEAPCVLDDVALGARIEVDPSGIDVDVERMSLRAAIQGLPPLWADGSLRYGGLDSPPRAEIRRLAVATERSHATLRGELRNLAELQTARSDLSLTIEGLAPSDVSAFAPGWAPADWLAGSIRLLGPADDLRARFELSAGPGRVQGDVRADALATPIAADGTIELRELDLARMAGATKIGGVASGRIEAAMRGADVQGAKVAGHLQVRGASFREWRFGDLAATASLTKGVVSMEGTLQGPAGTARAKGSAELAGAQQFQLAASLVGVDPRRLDPRAPNGDVTLEARVEGGGFDLARQRSRAIVEVASSKVASLAIDRGRADLQLADGRLRIAELSLTAPDASLRAEGDVGLSAAPSGRATVQARIGNVTPLLALAGMEGRGSLTLDAAVQGAAPDLAASGSLKARSFGTARAWIEHGSGSFDLRGIGGQAPTGRVEASLGGLHSAVDLESVEAQVTLSEVSHAVGVDGALRAKDLGGRQHAASFHAVYDKAGLDVRLAELHLEAPRGSFDLERPAHLALRSGVVTIDDLRVSGTKGELGASGRLSRTGAQRLDVTMRGVPLEWLRSFTRERTDVTGIANAELGVTGTAASPELAATVSVSDLRVAGQAYAGLRATIGYRAPTATLEARFDQDASHALALSGRAPVELRWDPELVHRIAGDVDLAVRSDGLDLAFANVLAPGALRNVAGEIAVDLETHGPLDRPAPRGTIALRAGAATISRLGIDVRAVTLALAIAPDVIRITDLSAASHDGHLSGGGTISMVGYKPDRLDLRLAFDRWPAIATNRYRSDVSAEIFCRGPVGAPQVSGTIDVLWGLLRPNLDFLTRAPAKRDPTIRIVSPPGATHALAAQPPAAPSPAEPWSIYKNTLLDVTLTVHRNTWVSHADASVELAGTVVARKQPGGDLQLTGQVDTVHGWMDLQGRRFQIAHGALGFTGGRKIDPSLDVTADYRAGEYVVHVILGGTVSTPSLKLASDPSLAQADILSVLMFGKTARDLNEGQKADVQNGAAQLAASYASGELGRSVSDALGLSGRGIQLQELSASRVALGTYLTDKTFVTVGQRYGAQQGQEMRVEYELAPRWSITSSAASAGGSGADIIWHRRY